MPPLETATTIVAALAAALVQTPLAAAAAAKKPCPTQTRVMVVTAYCACRTCCGPNARGITASGLPVTANGGLFVAAHRSIPLGAEVRIRKAIRGRRTLPAYAGGQFVPVLDRGSARVGIDVFVPSHQEALRWGRERRRVEIRYRGNKRVRLHQPNRP